MIDFNRYHIRLLVDKFRECFSFYRDTLGLPVRYGTEDADYAEFKTDTIHIALYKKSLMRQVVDKIGHSTNSNSENQIAIILRVDDVDHINEHLRVNGMMFDTNPEDREEWDCRTAHFLVRMETCWN
ncbi:MAG: VOC family protein [Chloroflexi bacterium]|jgi:lactoylglutathione lyase|nr:VOC family protein [Chloroflexota bacterium]